MFTGLIKNIGVIQSITKKNPDYCFKIQSDSICKQLQSGDSISVNGVCLTVENVDKSFIQVTAVQETIRKTNLNTLKKGCFVNLEPALRLSDALGGHLVQGHIDCTGTVTSISKEGNSHLIDLLIKSEFDKYLIEHGSVAINGVSLTLANVTGNRFRIVVIPYTWQNTNLKYLKVENDVNIEFDYIGKWVEKFNTTNSKKLDLDIFQLKSMGF